MADKPTPEPVQLTTPAAVLIVMTTVPDAQVADRIARTLVEERLVACVNRLAPCRSTYRWQGEVEEADEVPLLMKTTTARWPQLQARLKALHPYQVPEMLAWRPDAGWSPYADWVLAEARPSRSGRPPSSASRFDAGGGAPDD